ncbi:gastric triacylglycerol lipase-like [Ornithodoros turicata]|uniref:gastric triacylglycerol lipase-like n=1 Tax=Ornithodoros turicata TaxID=34597 RepID=UPI003139BB6D
MLSLSTVCFLGLQLTSLYAQQVPVPFFAFLDPDALRNVSQLISSKGYPVEEYEVITRDGFVLNVQRIPHGRDQFPVSPGKRREVVFLQHGLLSSSADWVMNFPDESLGYILADAGYDVWLGNVRGNTYSHHLHYTRKDKEFWDFSFDDMIEYDLPAMLDFILKVTGAPKLQYVGHSQGTLMLFGLLSEQPQYNEKIKLFSALGPVSTVTYTISPIRLLAPWSKDLNFLFTLLGEHAFLPSNRFMKFLANTMCSFKISRLICEDMIFLICGIDSKEMNETRLPVYISHTPAGTSVKNMVHYGQMIEEKSFSKFDYGWYKNELAYGQMHPPEYNVSRTAVPVALYWSQNDWLADPKDVLLLKNKLPNVALYFEVPDKGFTHLDFVIGMHANKLVYPVVLKTMRDH